MIFGFHYFFFDIAFNNRHNENLAFFKVILLSSRGTIAPHSARYIVFSAVVVLKMADYIVPRQEVPTEIRRIEGGRIAVKAYLFVGIELLDVLSLFAHAIKEIAYNVILFCH